MTFGNDVKEAGSDGWGGVVWNRWRMGRPGNKHRSASGSCELLMKCCATLAGVLIMIMVERILLGTDPAPPASDVAAQSVHSFPAAL